MRKFVIFLCLVFVFLFPTVYAEEFDTNKISTSSGGASSTSSLYKYWAYYKETGTRYVIRVYDWNTQKYIAVPKQYYINHIQQSSKKQIIYLGVDKQSDGKYEIAKSGKTIFSDNTYQHITKWYDNGNVKYSGLTKNDVNLLASVIKEKATKNGDIAVVKNMQDVIDGIVPYDVRAEILFLVKIPGTSGAKKTAYVLGKGSIENYSFQFYANKEKDKNKWRKEYLTYLECRAVAYSFKDDCGFTIKSNWLDKVACALYEKDEEYVFANGVYQCSCDWYKNRFGSNASYSLSNKQIVVNQAAKNPNNSSDRWYMYYTPGRCGVPINISGKVYYITPGKTYSNLSGNKVKVNAKIKYTDRSTKAQDNSYLDVVTADATKATIYEGWDYITNKMGALSVVAVDNDTGNVIKENEITYSTFENVKEGTYTKKAWTIPGYTFLGYISKNDLKIPFAPIGIANTQNNVDITFSKEEIEKGAKKQVIFVYQKEKTNQQEVCISIYNMKKEGKEIMYTGSFLINDKHKLSGQILNKSHAVQYQIESELNAKNDYEVNTNSLEEKLKIDHKEYQYLGYYIKTHSDYFLPYGEEELNHNTGNIYNFNQIGTNKVHIIIGYVPVEEIDEGNPGLKISYYDEKGNPIPNKNSKITEEKTGEEINTTADDLRKDMYMYVGYAYIDSLENYEEIKTPIAITGKEDTVHTTFTRGYDRRHIAFIYRKIELEFDIDIVMKPDCIANQLIGQKETEDYWVLDESGKVYIKVKVKGAEGLNILNYGIKLRIPFDTIMNGTLVSANSTNNLTVSDLSQIIVADKLTVPVWVQEKKYDISATIEANVDGFGIVSATKTDDVEIVGRLYDFTVTNLDGSDQTGDEQWKKSLFHNEDIEYKASLLPIGQSTNQPEKYYYGIKMGTTFYFSINTKGIKNNTILIQPKFLYVDRNGKSVKEVDIYMNENGKLKNIANSSNTQKVMKLRDNNILKPNVIQEVKKQQEINKVIQRYQYTITENRSVGNLSQIRISHYLSLPYVNYISEFQSQFGKNSMQIFAKTEGELLSYVSHWYGKYAIPASCQIVPKGTSLNDKTYEDGYLIVCFQIISLDKDNGKYLSYNLPSVNTQWQKEQMNQLVNLPMIHASTTHKEILLDTLKEGYASVAIYQVGVSILDNSTSVGTH